MAERSYRRFVADSLEALAGECPAACDAMAGALANAVVAVRIGDEEFALRCSRGRILVCESTPAASVEVRTDRRTIVDVIAARISLLEAIDGDRLFLRGTPAALTAFHDALMFYIAGALRAPAFPVLLEQFERRAPGRPQEAASS